MSTSKLLHPKPPAPPVARAGSRTVVTGAKYIVEIEETINDVTIMLSERVGDSVIKPTAFVVGKNLLRYVYTGAKT